MFLNRRYCLSPRAAKPAAYAKSITHTSVLGSCALSGGHRTEDGQARGHKSMTSGRAREYALFLKELAAQYPTAEKIRLVQDNLNRA